MRIVFVQQKENMAAYCSAAATITDADTLEQFRLCDTVYGKESLEDFAHAAAGSNTRSYDDDEIAKVSHVLLLQTKNICLQPWTYTYMYVQLKMKLIFAVLCAV